MKKTIKIIIVIVICLALVFLSFFVGYFSSQGGFSFAENKAKDSSDNDVHSIYNNYFSSESGKKFLIIKDEDKHWCGENNLNCIGKDILFFDIDSDKVDECFLNVKFEGGFEYVYIFDIENSQIRLVNDSELLWSARSNFKFRLIQVPTGEYRILKYIQDSNKAIVATIYNYNGYSLVPYKSFFANTYKYDGYDGEYFLSKEVDFLKEEYENDQEFSRLDESFKISEDEFYCQWDYYTGCCKMFIISPAVEEF